MELAWNAAANLHNGPDARGTILPQISGGTNQIQISTYRRLFYKVGAIISAWLASRGSTNALFL